MRQKQWIWTVLFVMALTGFTCYVLADTFLISRVYTVVTENSQTPSAHAAETTAGTTFATTTVLATSLLPAEKSAETLTGTDTTTTTVAATTAPAEPIITDTSYDDGHIAISITTYREQNTAVYVADVQLDNPSLLRTAFAKNAYGRNVTETTSTIAGNVGALLAINGDYYGAQENGFVLRNGVIYRDTSSGREDLVIWADGTFSFVDESNANASELLQNGAQQVLSFGPALVRDGAVSVTEWDEVGRSMASNPRTAVGIIDSCHYVFLVSDGRTQESAGLSLYETAAFLQSLGCTAAYNLDGGGSSTMVFRGNVINNPTTNGDRVVEREVSDIVYIGYSA